MGNAQAPRTLRLLLVESKELVGIDRIKIRA